MNKKTFGKTVSSLTNRESVLIQITDVSVSGEDQETVKGKELPLEQFRKAGNRCPFWGGIMIGARTPLIPYRGFMTADMYRAVAIDGIVRPFRVNHGHQFVLVDDNAPAHRAQRVNAAFREYDITRLDWPAGAADLNPIEHAWDALKRAVWNRQPRPQTVPELREAAFQEWDRLLQEMLDNLILSMPRRIFACARARGGVILY